MVDALKVLFSHGGPYPFIEFFLALVGAGLGLLGLVRNRWHLGVIAAADAVLLALVAGIGSTGAISMALGAQASASPEQKEQLAAIGVSEALYGLSVGAFLASFVMGAALIGMLRGPRAPTAEVNPARKSTAP